MIHNVDMKKFIKILLISFILLIFSPAKTSAIINNEEITSFHSNIEINQDTSINITEEIKYKTILSKHGIYRYLPINYNKDGQKEVLRISNINITDELGNYIEYTKSFDSNFLTLKIGDPDVTFTGNKTYIINYSVERAINKLDDRNQLYWDITGEGWKIPIISSSTTITSKFAPIKSINCFTGKVGGNDSLCQFDFEENSATFSYPKTIRYGSNFTIMIDLEKDSQLIFPSKFERLLLWFKYNWTILLIPIPLILIIRKWFKQGRDIQFISANVFNLDKNRPTKFRPIQFKPREPFVYEPLKGLTPGEAGALLTEKVRTQDIIAEILELARKKYLKIEVIEKKTTFW